MKMKSESFNCISVNMNESKGRWDASWTCSVTSAQGARARCPIRYACACAHYELLAGRGKTCFRWSGNGWNWSCSSLNSWLVLRWRVANFLSYIIQGSSLVWNVFLMRYSKIKYGIIIEFRATVIFCSQIFRLIFCCDSRDFAYATWKKDYKADTLNMLLITKVY